MVLMTKFDGSSAASQWLHIFKKELASQLSLNTLLKRADTYLKSCATSWAEQTPKVIRIFADKNLETATVENKSIFIQLMIQEFPGDSCNVITDEKASAELSSLAQKEDKDLCTYYCWTKRLLKRIYGRD